jgi:large subunit ribosomal protein L18
MKIKTKKDRRHRIQLRSRNRIRGTAERPRMVVFRSLAHIAVQVIDDTQGRTLVAASSNDKALRERFANGAGGGNVKGAAVVGTAAAERLKAQGITRVVFDRAGFLYHGRVKAVADAARAAGLEF